MTLLKFKRPLGRRAGAARLAAALALAVAGGTMVSACAPLVLGGAAVGGFGRASSACTPRAPSFSSGPPSITSTNSPRPSLRIVRR